MKIGWVGNGHFQATGYGRVAHYVLKYVQNNSKHQMVEFCATGLNHARPFDWNGVKVYGQSGRGGEFGVADLPVITERENVDIWLINFDAWSVVQAFRQMDFPYAIYPPVDHDPLPRNWVPVLEKAKAIVPYTHFGDRVIREGIDQVHHRNIYEPIYHGVDTDAYRPMEVNAAEVFKQNPENVPPESFIVGIFKNNQGTRPKYDVQLQGFRQFLDMIGPDKPAFLYIHAFNTGRGAHQLDQLIHENELNGRVIMVAENKYRFALPDEKLNQMYNACDVVMNVTASEGFGMTITEAMAAGTPVIGGGFSSMPELIDGDPRIRRREMDGVTESERGWIVPVSQFETTPAKHSKRATYKPCDVADALYEAYQERGRLPDKGKMARTWVMDYTWEKVGQKWVGFFDQLEDKHLYEPEPGEQKKAIIVVGPESSGTRITTKIFKQLGAEGDTGHKQRWDSNLPTDEELIVWRRSLPHDGQWPNIHEMAEDLRGRGYVVLVCVTVRDHLANIASATNAPYLVGVQNAQIANRNIQRAYKQLFNQLGEINFAISSYENLVSRPEDHVNALAQLFGLDSGWEDVDLDIKDGNEKWYEEIRKDAAEKAEKEREKKKAEIKEELTRKRANPRRSDGLSGKGRG